MNVRHAEYDELAHESSIPSQPAEYAALYTPNCRMAPQTFVSLAAKQAAAGGQLRRSGAGAAILCPWSFAGPLKIVIHGEGVKSSSE
jgi:hypothetical protein